MKQLYIKYLFLFFYINLPTFIDEEPKKLNIPFHFHLLRHTYASTLVNANVPPRIAMDLLRHSNYATTMNIYTHIADEQKKNIVNKIFK